MDGWRVIEGISPADSDYPLEVLIDGKQILIFRLGAKLCGIQRHCPHQDADMKDGKVIGEMLKCPRHGYIFRLNDGRCMNFPGVVASVYDVDTDGQRWRVRRRV
jgi:nitrite reductase/ring-hydroxylating ferredoxin subunit